MPFTRDTDGLRDDRSPDALLPLDVDPAAILPRVTVVALLLLILTAIVALGCTRQVVRVPAPLVLIAVPTPSHDLTAWDEDDDVCVAVPPAVAIYVRRRCLSMRAIRALILASAIADESSR